MCPLRFLVISVIRQLRNVQSFKTYVFRFWTFCHERDTSQADYPILTRLHGKLSPRLTGLPYLADQATRLGGSPHSLCKRDQDKVRNYMDRRVTSPTWGPPGDNLPCKRLKVGSPHLSCKRDQNKVRNYMNRWLTPPRRVTSPTNCICVVETDSGYLSLGNLRSVGIIYFKNMDYVYVSAFLYMLHENNFSAG